MRSALDNLDQLIGKPREEVEVEVGKLEETEAVKSRRQLG